MATEVEQLILRGLHLVIRTTFAPNESVAQAKHFAALQADIGPWFSDYAAELAKLEGRKDHDHDNDRGPSGGTSRRDDDSAASS